MRLYPQQIELDLLQTELELLLLKFYLERIEPDVRQLKLDLLHIKLCLS